MKSAILATALMLFGCSEDKLPELRGLFQEFLAGRWSESKPDSVREFVSPSDVPSKDKAADKWELYRDAAKLIEGLDAIGGYWQPSGEWIIDEQWGMKILMDRQELHSNPTIGEAVLLATKAVKLNGGWKPGMCNFGELRTKEIDHPTFQSGNALYWLLVGEAIHQFDTGKTEKGVEGIVHSICFALDWAVSGDAEMEKRGLRWLASNRSRPYLNPSILHQLSVEQATTIWKALALAEESISLPSNSPLRSLEFWYPKLLSDDVSDTIHVSKEEVQWILDWKKQLKLAANQKGPALRTALETLRRDRFLLNGDWFIASMLGRGDQAVLETRLHCRTVLAAQRVLLGLHLGMDFTSVPDPQGGEMQYWKDGETIKVLTSGLGVSPSELFEL